MQVCIGWLGSLCCIEVQQYSESFTNPAVCYRFKRGFDPTWQIAKLQKGNIKPKVVKKTMVHVSLIYKFVLHWVASLNNGLSIFIG